MRAINRNKIIAVMAAIVVFMVSMCTYSAEANATNTSREYWVYNAQTGTYLRKYTLGALSDYNNTGNTRDIIGIDDERQPDWSKSGVVKIYCKFIDEDGLEQTSMGTGFVVDEHTIATAAHCLFDFENRSRNKTEIMIFNTSGEISLNASAVEYHIPLDFIARLSSVSDTNAYDYALITVEEDLSDYMCFNLGVMLDSFITTGNKLYVTGFPALLNNNIPTNGRYLHNMCTGEGYLVNNTDYPSSLQLAYTNDATGGNSGGPVYITETRGNYTYNTVIAVHTTSAGTYNIGTRITTDLLHFYLNNSNKVYE